MVGYHSGEVVQGGNYHENSGQVHLPHTTESFNLHSSMDDFIWNTSAWKSEPDVGRVADGVAARVDRLAALGNGQVPQVMAMAFCILHERLSKRVGNGA